jgi:hypothetical protein
MQQHMMAIGGSTKWYTSGSHMASRGSLETLSMSLKMHSRRRTAEIVALQALVKVVRPCQRTTYRTPHSSKTLMRNFLITLVLSFQTSGSGIIRMVKSKMACINPMLVHNVFPFPHFPGVLILLESVAIVGLRSGRSALTIGSHNFLIGRQSPRFVAHPKMHHKETRAIMT